MITISANNEAGSSKPKLLFVKVEAVQNAPVIRGSLKVSAQVGADFSYQIVATESANFYAASGLPAGVTLNPVNGAITGSPVESGSFEATIVASNDNGEGAKAMLAIEISPRTPISIVIEGNDG